MFKLLMGVIVSVFIGIISYCLYSIFIKPLLNNREILKSVDNIDSIINNLKESIDIEEIRARHGEKKAEAQMLKYKEDLKKAENYKSKIKNI